MLHANTLTNRQDRLRTSKATTQFREGKTKTSQKSERSERSERHERPTRPERLKTSPPEIPKVHQQHPTLAKKELRSRPRADTSRHEQIQVNARLWRSRTTTMREGVTKTSKKSNRSNRSKRPDNLRACAPPNHPRRLQLLQSPRLRIRRPPGLTSIDDNQVVFIENAGEKRVRAHLKLGFYHPISSKQAI